jgi:hypothetical protein
VDLEGAESAKEGVGTAFQRKPRSKFWGLVIHYCAWIEPSFRGTGGPVEAVDLEDTNLQKDRGRKGKFRRLKNRFKELMIIME